MCKYFLFFFILLSSQAIFAYEIAIVSMFRNCAPYIKEWVAYHHMIGVDHFWLYDDASTDDWREALKDYLDAGIVEVFNWPSGKPDWTGGQLTAFVDGLNRGLNSTTWVALLDQDEFILPMQDKSLKDCLNNHFSKAGAVYMNWRHFGTSHITLPFGEPMLSKLISCSQRSHPANAVGKSIIRPNCAEISQLYTQHFCLLKPGFDYLNGDATSTLTFYGCDLHTDGKTHDHYIRINHYAHRDEAYFFNYRLPRDSNPNLILEHYKSFNITKDYTILNFIKKYYPDRYLEIWKSKEFLK